MNDNLKDILSHLSTEVDQETLLLYLQGRLTPEKQHEVEERLLDSDFESDALEGLQQVEDKQLNLLVHQLNKDLKERTHKKKSYREKLRFKDQPWLYFTLLIFLLLILICFFIVMRHLR